MTLRGTNRSLRIKSPICLNRTEHQCNDQSSPSKTFIIISSSKRRNNQERVVEYAMMICQTEERRVYSMNICEMINFMCHKRSQESDHSLLCKESRVPTCEITGRNLRSVNHIKERARGTTHLPRMEMSKSNHPGLI